MKNRLLATALVVTATMLLAATAAPAQVNTGIKANVGATVGGGHARANVGTSVGVGHVGVRQHAMVGVRANVAPPGFHHPPGWSHGRKVGWRHA